MCVWGGCVCVCVSIDNIRAFQVCFKSVCDNRYIVKQPMTWVQKLQIVNRRLALQWLLRKLTLCEFQFSVYNIIRLTGKICESFILIKDTI